MTAVVKMSVASLNRKASQFRKKAAKEADRERLEEERKARLLKHKDVVDRLNAFFGKPR